MSIDSKRLTKDCANAQATLAAAGYGLRRTGATAIIEPILTLILELRAQKHSWAAIAAALAKQGVVQGVDREPITARRLRLWTDNLLQYASTPAILKASKLQSAPWNASRDISSESLNGSIVIDGFLGISATRIPRNEATITTAFTNESYR